MLVRDISGEVVQVLEDLSELKSAHCSTSYIESEAYLAETNTTRCCNVALENVGLKDEAA